MNRYIIFYVTSKSYDSVVVDAESLDDAFETARAFSRVHAVTIMGIFDQTCYFKIYPHE